MPDIIQLHHAIEDSFYNLAKLEDKIYLLGFGSPLTPMHKLKDSPAYLNYKEQVRALNDTISSTLKGILKVAKFTPSLANTWLKEGHDYSRAFLGETHDAIMKIGFDKEKALVVLTGFTLHTKINRQTATFSTSPAIDGTGGGFSDIKLPLRTGKGGISGEMATELEAAVGNIKLQLRELYKQPQAVILFEKTVKQTRGIYSLK